MTIEDVYQKLGEHLSGLGMGYPYRDDLIQILEENFTPLEVEVALAIPTGVIPLQPAGVDEILERTDLPREKLEEQLEGLEAKGMLFSGTTGDGEKGYALHQVGFGFPQTFFWKGEETPHTSKMAKMVAKYFNRKVTQEAYASETKPFRYIPVSGSIHAGKQAVYPHHSMEGVINQAELLAVAHCPCRIAYSLCGRNCTHPVEVCLKFDEMARYVIDSGLAREITKEEAHDIIKLTEEAGLVHFVDNVEGDIKHNCNCCGCACWNVGNIKRRKIPRDVIMATYFIRQTDGDECIGCGECIDVCPVDAVKMEDDVPVIDMEWCIGCGVCATACTTGAITMILRPDRTDELPTSNFKELHEMILEEKVNS